MDNEESKPSKAARLVGDLFREGSNIAKVYSLLADAKPHTKKETAACVGVKEDRWPHVFATLMRRGRDAGWFSVVVEDDTATLTFEKEAEKPKAKKTAKVHGGSHAKA